MSLKRLSLIFLGILCMAEPANATQGLVVNTTGITITDQNSESHSMAFSEAITEYVVAAFSTAPSNNTNSYLKNIDVDKSGPVPVIIFYMNNGEKLKMFTSGVGVDDVRINIVGPSNDDRGTLQLSAGALADEKLRFDYQAGLLIKWFFSAENNPVSIITINGNGDIVTIEKDDIR